MKRVNDAFIRNLTADDMRYDDFLTGKRWYHRLYNRIFWGEKNSWTEARIVLDMLPKDFSGRLLDVPAGTGVFTLQMYQQLPNAEIVCLDYSPVMLERFRRRAGKSVPQVTLTQGDVGELPFEDESFDGVLCMNGYHCFPEKEDALSEILRVIRPGGWFVGCTYVRGVSRRTDFFVKNLYTRWGIFMEPHPTASELRARLARDYTVECWKPSGSMICFRCRKPSRG